MSQENISFYDRAGEALQNSQLQSALGIGTTNLVTKRAAALAAHPHIETIRDRARQIRAYTLSRLDHYLAEFADNVAKNGGQVYWAADAFEAVEYVANLAREEDIDLVVKSKSMVTEEIGLNHRLQADNVNVVETDLGEFIIQLGDEGPSHIIAPAMHKTRYEVGDLFHQKLGVAYTDDPIALNDIARAHLRERFLTAGMGISGVNFAVADSGSVALVTNEGNGRFVTSAPRIHVAMMGMERIVPTFDDLQTMLQVLGRSATGQKMSVYTSMVSGPRREQEADGPEQFHVVIVDNGRSKTLGSDVAEILYCIRCGACLNHCPVYQAIGGHAYNSPYSGPIGSVISPLLMGMANHAELPHACSLCGRCGEVCPVRIDLPGLLLKLRDQGVREGHAPGWLARGVGAYRQVATNPGLYRLAMRGGRLGTQLLGRGGAGKFPGPLSGWTTYRNFPVMTQPSFHQQWAKRKSSEDRDGS